MYKQPLFGEDSSPHITSMLVSAIVTLVCWIIFCVLCLVIKFKPQTPQYKEVQIVLSSTPVVEKEKTEAAESAPAAPVVEEAASVVPEPVEGPAKVETTPVAQAKVEASKKDVASAKTNTASAKPQTQSKTKETPTDKKVSYDIVKSVDELMEEQLNSKKQTTAPDWFFEDDDMTEEPTVSQSAKVVDNKSGFEGSSANVTTADQRKTSADSNPQKDNKNIQESEATKTALARIAKATPYSKSTGNIDSTVTAQTAKSNDGSVNLKMSDGSIRKLRNPTEPKIELPPAVAEYVTEDLSVIIKIKVLDKGNVLLTNIDITPPILPEPVKNEVMRQLNRWLFDEDPNVPLASAEFEYTIKKN